MKVSYLLSALVIFFISISIITTETGCASIVPPTGGPRDSLPPVVLNIDPRDSARLFKEKKITITFNEFVQLVDVQQNLIMSPTTKTNPITNIKLKTVVVTIKDTLDENTTYSLDFGNSIRDLNEGNPLRNFRYVFSTGTTIDTLELGGRVLVAETGKADSTLVVILHTKFDDSAVVKEKPRYVTRVDTAGYFSFRNLASGTYAMYALEDEGGQRRFLSKEQLFAFADTPIASSSGRRDILLYAFHEKDTTTKPESTLKQPERRPATGIKVDRDRAERLLRYQTNVSGGLDLLQNFEFNFSPEPLRSFDSTQVLFTDEAFTPIRNYYFIRDTSNKKVTLVHPWIENTSYNVIIDTLFAEDTLGRRILKKDTISFQTKRNSEYGLVRLRFMNLSLADNPVLQFIQGDDVKVSHTFTNNVFFARLFTPGEYELRIVSDRNRNGEWDTGQFFGERRQPERVLRISRKINVKANWDNEVDIQL